MKLIVGVLLLGGVGAGILAYRAWPMINIVETGRTPEYPDILSPVYQATAGEIFDGALHVVDRLPRWSLVEYDESQGKIRAEARTALWGFVDDVTISVGRHQAGTVVEIRSASRVGRGDFGQNARNIRRFLEELDRQVKGETIH